MNKLIKYVLAVLFFISVASTYAQKNDVQSNPDDYSQVRIFAKNENDIEKMMNSGLLLDHAESTSEYTDTWLSQKEIEMLKSSGVAYNILIKNWKEYYDNLPKMSAQQMQSQISQSATQFGVSHSIFGSMGGFLTYSEIIAKLDSMRLQYPELISQKFSIGPSVEGRQIWTVRVTKNPNSPTGRPEVWYHSLIHAREPESMEHLIYFMYWLFENYNTDPIATYILNNRELYFTPVLNPDGYEFNKSTNPQGGGFWRKNRRINADGTIGVDLNRNYGTYQYWNSSNGGSSTTCSSDVYRGTAPFSEPETRAVMNFVNSRNFQAILDAHAFGNKMLKPWAWQDPIPTPDDNKFNEYFSDMTKFNHYQTGTATQTVGYKVRGQSLDWYYNDSVHSPHRIITMCSETGTGFFWAEQANILPLAEGMLYSNQYLAMLAGAFVYPLSSNLNKQSYSPGESGTLKINFRNKGLAAANVKIQCTSESSYLNVPITFFNYSNFNSFRSDSATFGFTVSPTVPNNSAMPVKIKFIQNDSGIVYEETKHVLTGNGTLTLSDSAENGFSKWTTNGNWGVTTLQSHSPAGSFTESPSGNYTYNENSSMTLNASVNVSSSPVTFLSFWHKYVTEPRKDFCYLEVSSNNGANWQTVTEYNGSLTAWSQQIFDITSYAKASTQLKVRFRLQCNDMPQVADGWYVDDIKITNYSPQINNVVTNLNLKLVPEGFYNSDLNLLKRKDTVMVYLKNITAPYSTVDSARGVIDSLTLSGNFGFRNAPSGNYYIVVKHRNSIETWSKLGGMTFTFGGNMNYDFTSSASQAFGNNMIKIDNVPVRFAVYSGDVNQDGAVNLSDVTDTYNSAKIFKTGYVNTDFTGDGMVDLTDIILAYKNGANFVATIRP